MIPPKATVKIREAHNYLLRYAEVLKKILIVSFAALVAAVVSGCAPRGESKSLTEIYENSKARYEAAQLDGLDSEASESLRNLASLLSGLESSTSKAPQLSAEVAESLNRLILKAGYTTRPALGEIILQYRLISDGKEKASVSEAHVKLLMARTYRLLAQELETTRFQV